MVNLDWQPVEHALSDLIASLEAVEYDTHGATSHLTDQINGALADTSGGILDALIQAVTIAGDLASGLLDSLAGTDDFWSALGTYIRDQWQATYEPIMALFQGAIANSMFALGNYAREQLDATSDALGAWIKDREDAPRDPQSLLSDLNNLPPALRYILGLVANFVSLYSYANASQSAGISQWTQASMMRGTPVPLSVSQVTELLKRQAIGHQWAYDMAARSGISAELFDVAMNLERTFLTVDMIADYWRRTGDDSQLEVLEQLGFIQEDRDKIKALALSEATPSDVVRFLVRDVFDAGAVERGKLDEDFEAKYNEEQFRKAGVTRDLARNYWMAHWQLPSPTQGYEMLHRGLLDIPQLTALLKQADYAPGYVQHLIDIAYNVPGRIDLRNMWSVGLITERTDLVTRYGHLGYSPADSEVLADFAIALDTRRKHNEAERKRAPLAAQIIRSYLQGTLSEEATRDTLISLGFSPDDADYRINEGRYGRERDRSDRIRDSVGRMYVRGYLDENGVVERMASYGFLETEIAFSLDSWRIDRELKDLTDAERHERDLTRADIVTAYREELLSGESAHQRLQQIGYDETEASVILDIEYEKQRNAQQKLDRDATRVQYVNRRIDESEAKDQLRSAGLSDTDIDNNIRRWTVEREEKAPDLPIAWLEKMIFNATISKEDAQSELERRGFTAQEVDWALRLWGEEVSVARDRLAQQRQLAEEAATRQASQFAQRLSVQERALALRERTATTAQLLQQERFQQTLEQRDRLAQQRIDATAAGRVQSASLQAERDARQFARAKELQANGFAAQQDRLNAQINAALDRARLAAENAQELQTRREQMQREREAASDARQQARIDSQLVQLQARLDAAQARADEANQIRLDVQARAQAFADQQRLAREQAQRARDVEQEAARIRAESRGEARAIRTETRGAARRTIERTETAITAEQLRSLQLQRDSAIAELNARLAALEAESADARIAHATEQQRIAQETLSRLVGPALTFEPGL